MQLKWGLVVVVMALSAARVQAEEPAQLTSKSDLLNYSIGVETARNLKKQEIELNLDMIVRGMKDGLSGAKILIPEKVLRKTMNDLQTEVRRKQSVSLKTRGEENKKLGEKFLAENKEKDGVAVLPSGVQYRVVKPGNGAKPVDTDTVQVNYRGTLLNGAEFDASQEGKPASFSLKTVIPGWRDALKNMPAGSTWQIFIPPHLAYGARGAGKDIGPNETLIFDVELIAINK
jgi:FKBP-type peptidyl-prolyl cis-trans isomerase